MTLMSILKLTAAQAAALNPAFPGQGIFLKDSGSGFDQDTVYFRNAAGSAWLAQLQVDYTQIFWYQTLTKTSRWKVVYLETLWM
jgi:hypothetical protein